MFYTNYLLFESMTHNIRHTHTTTLCKFHPWNTSTLIYLYTYRHNQSGIQRDAVLCNPPPPPPPSKKPYKWNHTHVTRIQIHTQPETLIHTQPHMHTHWHSYSEMPTPLYRMHTHLITNQIRWTENIFYQNKFWNENCSLGWCMW